LLFRLLEPEGIAMTRRHLARPARLFFALCFVSTSAVLVPHVDAATVSFLGVAAGDASSTTATVWTRALPSGEWLDLEITADPAFKRGVKHLDNACMTDSAKDSTCKHTLTDLDSETVYYYRFVASSGD